MRPLRHRVVALLSTALVALRLLAPEAFSPCLSWHGDARAVAPATADGHTGHGPAAHAAHGDHAAHRQATPAIAEHATSDHATGAHAASADVTDAHHAPSDGPACPHCESGDCCCVAPALNPRVAVAVPAGTVDLSRAPVGAAPETTPRSRAAFLLPFGTAPPALG